MFRDVPQLIGISATLENPQQICQFIDAQFVEYTKRLNQLDEFGIAEKRIYKIGGHEAIGDIEPSFNIVSDKSSVIGYMKTGSSFTSSYLG
jgi:replicative superfamily II helicase